VCIFNDCSLKQVEFGKRKTWSNHLLLDHGLGTSALDYSCPLCLKSISQEASIYNHIAKHLEEISLAVLPRSEESISGSEESVKSLDESTDGSNDGQAVTEREDPVLYISDEGGSDIDPPRDDEGDNHSPSLHQGASSIISESEKEAVNEDPPGPASQPGTSRSRGTSSVIPHPISAIVDFAVDKAYAQGNIVLSRALKKVYLDSAEDAEFQTILHSILTQRPTEDQIVEFQRRIKQAKAEIIAEDSTTILESPI